MMLVNRCTRTNSIFVVFLLSSAEAFVWSPRGQVSWDSISSNRRLVRRFPVDLSSCHASSSFQRRFVKEQLPVLQLSEVSDDKPTYNELSIAELLEEVDKRGIRYSPTTSRRDLERMLQLHDRETNYNKAPKEAITPAETDSNLNSSAPKNITSKEDVLEPVLSTLETMNSTLRNQLASMSISEILAELDQRDIRYSPTATPSELRELLEMDWPGREPEYIAESSPPLTHATVDSPQPRSKLQEDDERKALLSLSALLDTLDERHIRYSPTATRSELLQLLEDSVSSEAPAPAVNSPSNRRDKRRNRRARLQRKTSYLSTSSSVLGSILATPIPNRASKTVAKALHKAKILSRKANEYLSTGEDGVRDVTFEYVKRDYIPSTRLKKPSHKNRTRKKDTLDHNALRSNSVTAVARLPPADGTSHNFVEMSGTLREGGYSHKNVGQRKGSSSRRRPRESSSVKRIYSPYVAEEASYKDGFDRFGDFLADSADKFMWGNYETANGTENPPDSVREPRHWKDRLGERFDYLLGMHDDESYYNSWTKKIMKEQENEGAFDALSVAQGRQPKRRGMPGGKKLGERAIWEQDNLISLLFGRNSKGNSNLFDKILSPNGSILNLLTAIFKSGVIVTSYLCRWASCRGALPQPIVVVGISTAVLCARPRYRLRIVALTLVALRAAGELLHGYVYGDEGWEDDAEDDVDTAESETNIS